MSDSALMIVDPDIIRCNLEQIENIVSKMDVKNNQKKLNMVCDMLDKILKEIR